MALKIRNAAGIDRERWTADIPWVRPFLLIFFLVVGCVLGLDTTRLVGFESVSCSILAKILPIICIKAKFGVFG